MTVLLLPLMVVSVVMLLVALLVAVAALGPVGWGLDVLLLLVLAWGTRECWRRSLRWWASTRAPELPRRDRARHQRHSP